MDGTEHVNPTSKFVEAFSRIKQLEIALATALDKIEEMHAVLNFVPPGLDRRNEPRKTLSLKSGTR